MESSPRILGFLNNNNTICEICRFVLPLLRAIFQLRQLQHQKSVAVDLKIY